MRRLPIFFLLDVSESMVGEPLYRLEDGIGKIIASLKTDPHAIETAWISIIAFAGNVRKLVPLTELINVNPPVLPVGGGTSLGRALAFLMDEIDAHVQKNTPDIKGDWRPIVFLITDGKPTDDITGSVERWRADYAGSVTMVAIAIGRSADLTGLNRLTEAGKVLTLDDDSEAGFLKFIQWVTQSVQARSRSVGDAAKEERLPDLDDSILKKLSLDKPFDRVDETNAYFVSKCQTHRLPYLSRYEPTREVVEVSGSTIEAVTYRLAGCYPVRNSYFEMSAEQPSLAIVDSSQIHGTPSCPHCGNRIGFAMCGCGNTFCMADEGDQTCPWCEQTARFTRMDDDGESVEINRARG